MASGVFSNGIKYCRFFERLYRTRIIDIVIEYEYLGYSPDEIVNAYPYLSLSQIHDVLSYYYENREQIDGEIKKRKEEINKLSEASLKGYAAKN